MNQEAKLRQLLERTDWDEAVMEEVAQLSIARQIKFKEGSRFALNSFRPLAKLQRLKWIHFKNSKITGENVQSLAKIPSLRRLDLSDCAFEDNDAQCLEAFVGHQRLQELWLSETSVSDATLPIIGKLDQLEMLLLSATRITDAGLKHLCNLKNLSYLLLNQTAVTDSGVLQLAVLPKLSGVGIQGSRSTPNCLDALFEAQLEKAQKVAVVDESECEVAAQVLTDFQKAMNEWEINAFHLYQEVTEKHRASCPAFNVMTDDEAAESKQVWDEAREVLREIFNRYCTVRERAYGKPEYFAFGYPPQYDPQTSRIVSVKQPAPNKMVFYLDLGNFLGEKAHFVLMKKRNKWLVDSRQRWDGGWKWTLL